MSDHVVEKVKGKRGIGQTKIAFKGGLGEATEIYVADYDGANPIAITPDKKLVSNPAWVPGRRVLFYTSYLNHYPDIFVQELSPPSRKVFAEFPGANLSPAISPDGKRVAMILSRDGTPSLYVCDIDGGNLKRLTSDRSAKSSPTWSGDGDTICYVSSIPPEPDGPGLYLIPANGGRRTKLRTPSSGTASEPDWSPDNKWIAFTISPSRGQPSIWMVPATGGDPIRLGEGEDSSWAPNSRTLVLTKEVEGVKVLSLLDAYTKVSKTLLINVKGCSEPAWAR